MYCIKHAIRRQTMQEILSKACNISITGIVKKSLKLFFDNLAIFVKYLAYPVFGQLLACLIIFIPVLIVKSTQNTSLLPVVFICTVIGLVIMLHAFWRYLIACVSMNLMARDLIADKGLQPLDTYTQNITQRSGKYVILLLLLSVISLIPCIFFIKPFMTLLYAIQGANTAVILNSVFQILILTLAAGLLYAPLFSVAMQSFTFEESLTPFENIKRSFALVVRNYVKTILFLIAYTIVTFILGAILGAVLYIVFAIFKADENIQNIVSTIISFFFTPLYCIMFTYWYFKLAYKEQECI